MNHPAPQLMRLGAFPCRGVVVLGAALYIALLMMCYETVISPVYSYAGLGYRELTAGVLPVSIAIALLPSLILPVDLREPSAYAVWFLYLAVVAPCSFVPLMVTRTGDADALGILATVASAFVALEGIRRLIRIKPFQRSGVTESLLLIIPAAAVLVGLFLLWKVGFVVNVGIGNGMYDRRFAARALYNEGALMVYLQGHLDTVLIPFTVALAVVTKRWYYVLVVGAVAVAHLSYDGTKSALFAPCVYCLIALLSQHRFNRQGLILLSGFLATVAAALAEARVFDSALLATYIVRRVLIMPAQLTTYYFEFWRDNPHVMMSDGLLGRLGIVPHYYDRGAALTIGSVYFASPEGNANANLWASGFAHFGYIGVFAASLLAGTILRLIDAFSIGETNRGRYIAGTLVATVAGIVWTNAAIQTSLLSNGIVTAVFLLALFPGKKCSSHRLPAKASSMPARSLLPGLCTTPDGALPGRGVMPFGSPENPALKQ